MRQVYIVSFATILPMILLGCGAQQAETSSTSIAPVPTPAVKPQIPSLPKASNPKITPGTTKIAQGSVGLIPSTNPEVRRKSVTTGGRNDPFKSLVAQPEIELSPSAAVPVTEPELGELGSNTSRRLASGSRSGLSPLKFPQSSASGHSNFGKPDISQSAMGPSFPRPGSAAIGTRFPVKPLGKPGTAIGSDPASGNGKSGHPLVKPSVPYVPPSTELAKAVEVSGVVQTGQTLVAIIRDPKEPTSRNVQAGERLANGQVLVKRISVGISGSPVIVLEQNGVEVIKTLGGSSAVTS